MRICVISTCLLMAAAELSGCGGDAPEAAAPVALVGLQPAGSRTLYETLTAYGTAEFAPADATSLTVQVESQVSELLVTLGAGVERGQPLMRLAPSRSTRLEMDRARRDAELAAADRERMQRLRRDGLATDSEVQAAVNTAVNAAALRDSLGAREGADESRILRAPRAGIVDLLDVKPGDVLAPGTIAVRIAPADSLQVRLGIEPGLADRVAAGQPVRVQALDKRAATVSATVVGVDRRVDPQARLIAALVRLPPRSGLLAGEGLRGDVVVAERKGAVTVPRDALLYAGKQSYVFVADRGRAKRREVKTGVRDGNSVEIVAGLKAGEPVVVSGNAVLEDGMAIRTPAGP